MPFCAPQIVYSNSWIGQTSNLPDQTLYTPATNGCFRINVFAYLKAVTNVTNLSFQINWPFGTGSFGPIATGIGPGTASAQVYVGMADNSNPITLSMVSTDANLDHYDLHVVIEQLQ